jgi:hypothetical protein
MIVFTQSLVLSPEMQDIHPGNPVILWENLITRANVEADSEAPAHPGTNLANPSTLEKWASESTDPQFVTFDTGVAEFNAIGIARHNFRSGNIAVALEALTSGEDPEWVVVVDEFLPGDDSPILVRFETGIYAAARLVLTPQDDTPPEIAVAYLGTMLHFPRGIVTPHTPLDLGRQTEIINGRSRSGNFLGSIVVGQSSRTQAVFRTLPRNWYYDTFEPVLNRGATAPFFFAWLPLERPNDVGYAWLDADPVPQFKTPIEGVDITLDMGGIVWWPSAPPNTSSLSRSISRIARSPMARGRALRFSASIARTGVSTPSPPARCVMRSMRPLLRSGSARIVPISRKRG